MALKLMLNYLMYLEDNINAEQFNLTFNFQLDLTFNTELSK